MGRSPYVLKIGFYRIIKMIHCLKRIGFLLVSAIVALSVMAEIGDLPVKTVNGKRYYYYEVQPKETVYSLCRRFGITREELIKANPSVEDGLKANQTLLFPVEDEGNSAAGSITYMVQKNETGYGISRKFNMTLDEFYQLNPSARDGVKAGQIVYVSRSGGSVKKEVADVGGGDRDKVLSSDRHTIAQGETLYQIGRKYGITVEQILAANPGLDAARYEAGQTITLPQVCPEDAEEPAVIAETPETPETPELPSDDLIDDSPVVVAPSDTMVIAIALPFNTGGKRDARAERAIEFYRGFVLAVDSMRAQGTPVRLLTYDTKNSDEVVAKILRDRYLKTSNLIIAPDMASHVSEFSKYALEHKINMLNLFLVKDDDYLTNPYVMHANIPHDTMYGKAIKYYIGTYPNVTPVFIKRKDGKDDKAEYVALFKAELNKIGRKYHEIEYVEKLSPVTLEKLPADETYAYIPNSSNMSEFQTFIDAIVKDKENRTEWFGPSLWGYSEWLTARGNNVKRLHEANTLVFSRFYSVENNAEEDELQEKFQHWYGIEVQDKIPKQGTYGFDTGMFLIGALSANGGDFSRFTPIYNGVQNAFDFIRVPDGGWVNNEMFMINFAPGEFTTKLGI